MAVWDDGSVTALHGHVDLGTGLRTALTQLVAEELDVDFGRIDMVMGDTLLTLDQGQTAGSLTISNGGIYGSMLSTPILNHPQAAIMGLHNIVERPVAENGQVVIRPIMYLALSYDHRLIDGKEAVTFLVKVRQYIEDPQRLLFGV